MHKKRVLFVGEGVTLAHIIRPLMLAKALNPQEYEVFFACCHNYKNMVEKEGLPWHEIHSISSAEFLKRLSLGDPLYSYEQIKSYVREDLNLLDQIKPDLVIGDFRISLNISCTVKKAPYICLSNVYWSPSSTLVFPIPEVPISRISLLLGKVVMFLFSSIFFYFHIKGYNKVRSEYGLSRVNDIKKMYTEGTWTLYLDLPSIIPVLTLPLHHQYLGPVCDMPDIPRPSWWGNWPKDKPLVYLSFGSSGDISLLEIFKDVLGKMDLSVILTTSGRYKNENFPSNFYVTDFLSGLDVAQIAQIFITNGGSGAIYQALNYGVPMLSLPSNMDQFFLAERIQELGAGILIRPSRATKENIKTAIITLLNNKKYKEVAGDIGIHMRNFNTKERFKEFIASVFKDPVINAP